MRGGVEGEWVLEAAAAMDAAFYALRYHALTCGEREREHGCREGRWLPAVGRA
jgi:hypothetical protein